MPWQLDGSSKAGPTAQSQPRTPASVLSTANNGRGNVHAQAPASRPISPLVTVAEIKVPSGDKRLDLQGRAAREAGQKLAGRVPPAMPFLARVQSAINGGRFQAKSFPRAVRARGRAKMHSIL